MFKKPILIGRVLAFTLAYLFNNLSRDTALRLRHLRFRILPSTSSSKARPAGIGEESTDKDDEEYCNVVVIGALFAGYEAARVLAKSLPLIPGPRRWRLVVVEPHSHFHFTWVLPRFCVVGEHEHKAFIPYGGYIGGASHDRLRWVQDRAVGVTRRAVQLQSGEEIPYDELSALPYLDAVIREMLRIHAPVPMTARVAMKDDVIPLSKPFVDRYGKTQDVIRCARPYSISS